MRRAFTLVELLVVVAMIALILGAISTSVSAAQKRARIQRATSDVKVITQAILAYENYGRSGNYELPELADAEASSGNLSFLLGSGGSTTSGEIPALLMAAFQGQKTMYDPWGSPYLIKIKKKSESMAASVASGSMKTGYFLPNFYRLDKGERSIWTD